MKLFNREQRVLENPAITATKVITAEKTPNEWVEEIHETFFTEVDRLLTEAKISKPIDKDKDLESKAARLRALGFSATKEIAIDDVQQRKNAKVERENEAKSNLVEAINYFSEKYPQHKFITEESVKKICEKYNLVYGGISKYEGTVPEKNLSHMESFKIDDSDECWEETLGNYSVMSRDTKRFCSKDDYLRCKTAAKQPASAYDNYYNYSKMPFDIAAPVKDFDVTDMEVKDHKLTKKVIEIPDPVILQPIFFKAEKHYLIVTAWGLEAEDELVVNGVHN